MAMESYSSQYPDQINKDVLSDARKSCFKARDAFFSCLEKQSNKTPTEVACVGLMYPEECKNTRQAYDGLCRRTWVKHFDRQYCAKLKGRRLLDDNAFRKGPMKLPQTSSV